MKDLAIAEREKNPSNIIIAISIFENEKSSIIITSKNNNVIEFINKNLAHLKIKGGGNNLMWQGVSSEEITLDSIKK